MGYEIDFLSVGSGERSGDAIAIRYGTPGAYRVMVVDGGDKAAGARLVDHILGFYRTSHVDYVVNSHPDIDHASGLEVVLENLTVSQLWLHRPWRYSEHVRAYCADPRFTPAGLRKRLCEALSHAHRLEQLAEERGIAIYEPYQGARIGDNFWVASPPRDWYFKIVHHFDKTPKTKAPIAGLLGVAMGVQPQNALAHALNGGALLGAGQWWQAPAKAATAVETWDIETLEHQPMTSFDNESSVVLFGQLDRDGILLTGDAGIGALNHAMDWLVRCGIDPAKELKVVQIPHHGSRHNVDPGTLDRMLGLRRPPGMSNGVIAIASAGPESTHPRKVVTNAFRRRGASVYTAKKTSIRHSKGMQDRPNWNPVPQVEFFSQVEF